jgi:CheY-like chemotaxis protein
METHELDVFAEFLSDQRTVIADSSSASRVRLAATLSDLGVQSSRIALCGAYEEALSQIECLKPKLVLCDFMLGNKPGLDLLQSQRQQHPEDTASVFSLITANTSQTAVARAAEEDVDTFILKPYTLELLKRSLVQAVVNKVRPSEYMKTIERGKKLLLSGHPEQAFEIFKQATTLNDSPTLAHFYIGQCKTLLEALQDAEGSYREGLSLNRIHYKCLVGLFDLMMKEKRHQDAYDIVKRISQYFPANPKRLLSVLRLAIQNEKYEDMEGYYRTFTHLDERDDLLVRYMCSALCVVGKYYLIHKQNQRAIEVFEKAAVSCAGQIQFLKYIIETLVEYGFADAAAPFFKKYRERDPGSSTTYLLEYLACRKQLSHWDSLKRGRALLNAGIKHPLLLKGLIQTCADSAQRGIADELMLVVQKQFPEREGEFRQIAEKAVG